MQIRIMHPGDLDCVLPMAEVLPTAPHWSRQSWLQSLDPSATPRRIALVAETGSQLLGFILVSLLPPDSELESIAVVPAAQRQGIGRALLEAACSAAHAAGATRMLLEVRPSSLAAELYRHAGFRETGRRPGYYADPKEDALLMERPLA
jgi:ribosomal-protein-alanine N-acetyltransferase